MRLLQLIRLRLETGELIATVLFLGLAGIQLRSAWDLCGALSERFDAAIAASALRILLLVAFNSILATLYLTRGPVIGQRSSPLNRLVAAAGSLLLMVPAGTKPDAPALAYLSFILVIGGTSFGIWAVCHLRNCFGVFPEVRGLVRSGPYSLVRHPLYSSYWVVAAGLIIAYQSWIFAGLIAVDAVFQVWRARNEEKALAEVFPAYAEYAAQTPMFLPFGLFR